MRERAEVIAGVENADLAGRTVLVTGSTAGIGREVALALGRLGATVLVHGREESEGRAVVEAVAEMPGDASLFLADFASLSTVEELADAVADRGPLDALVNNAGGYFHRGRLTADGFEYTFGVNHLAPFLLTNRLRPAFADDTRVVTTASRAHRDADGLDLHDVRSIEGYSGWQAYARSKLANVCFAAALASRLDGPTSYSFHPGFVPGSRFPRELPAPVRWGMRALAALPHTISGRLANTPTEGAATAVHLVAADDVGGENGCYFADCEPRRPSALARDRDRQETLWEHSSGWVGLEGEDIG